MRSLRRPASPYETFVDGVRPFMGKRLTELGGLALFTAAVAMTVALATWSIEDPSLNHATEHAARNVLGQAGRWCPTSPCRSSASVPGLRPAAGPVGRAADARARPARRRGADRALDRRLLCGERRGERPAADRPLAPADRLGGVAGDACSPSSADARRRLLRPQAAGGLRLRGDRHRQPDRRLPLPAARRGAGRAYPTRRIPVGPATTGRAITTEPGLGLVGVGALAQGLMRARASVAGKVETWRSGRGEEFDGASRRWRPAAPSPMRTCPGRTTSPMRPAARPGAGSRPSRTAPRARRSAPRPCCTTRTRTRVKRRSRWPPPRRLPPRRRGCRLRPPHRLRPAGRRRRPRASRRITSTRPSTLLAEPRGPSQANLVSADSLEQNATLLEATLGDFGVRGDILAVRPGPVVTLYELEPAPGTKSSRVIALADDIARSMSAVSAASPSSPAGTRSASNCRMPAGRWSFCASSSRPRTSWIPSTSSPCASARTSAASRSSPTSPGCLTCWSPAPPDPASRSPSTP